MWSTRRFPERLSPTSFARRLERAVEEAGTGLLDLTFSNPSDSFEEHRRKMSRHLREAAGELADRPYEPIAAGLPAARRAVAEYLSERGASIPASHIVLTASTSEAYGWLAKLLADPGDTILVPTPSYPLFEHLLDLEAVESLAYPLRFEGRWRADLGELRRLLDSVHAPAAIFAVRPNNPTGHLGPHEEWPNLRRLAAEHDLPLVVDEVFVDFDVEHGERIDSVLGTQTDLSDANRPLTFALGGLSKTAGLPGAKLGWIAVDGPAARLEQSLEHLEFVADTYLSASTPTQLATPAILANLDDYHHDARRRLSRNLATLDETLADLPALSRYPVEAGWYAIVRTPGYIDEAEFVIELVDESSVLVQPGFFYDLQPDGHLVVSLLTAPEVFEQGIDRAIRTLDRRLS